MQLDLLESWFLDVTPSALPREHLATLPAEHPLRVHAERGGIASQRDFARTGIIDFKDPKSGKTLTFFNGSSRSIPPNVDIYPLDPAADQAMKDTFARLAEARDEEPVLHIEHRSIRAIRRAGGLVWFDFRTLCGGPRSQNDYLEMASQFHTVLLSDVPHMPVRMASEARRFTWLVDVLYDRRVKLIMSAAVPPEALYTEGPLAHEFPRTISRLNEMQSTQYLALERRDVDTTIT